MKLRCSVLNLAATIVVMGNSFSIAADKQPPSEAGSQPAPRQVDQKEVEAGRAAARADIGKKLIRYDVVGQPSMIDPELKRLAVSKYNISVTFHGCCPGPRIDYDCAYLDVVIAHLKALYGFDPVAKLEKELREKQQ
ncbi:MAG: hypothetical protein ABL949_16285 [Fimbriimonadaceae bacterium]